jgi:hypothetical protein
MRGIFGSIAVALCLLLVGSLGCNPCKDVVLDRLPSPNGKWVATKVTRDCGGLGGEYVGVSIHDPSDDTTKRKDFVFLVKVRGPINMSWQGNERIVISCDCPDSNIKEKHTRLKSVEILYRTK